MDHTKRVTTRTNLKAYKTRDLFYNPFYTNEKIHHFVSRMFRCHILHRGDYKITDGLEE